MDAILCGEESGASRARTGDLQSATLALSQLSYGPVVRRQCSRELKILGPVNPKPLVVLRGRKTKKDLSTPAHPIDWEVITTPVIRAIRSNRVDFVGGIEPSP
jgi:hypothetical protein